MEMVSYCSVVNIESILHHEFTVHAVAYRHYHVSASPLQHAMGTKKLINGATEADYNCADLL